MMDLPRKELNLTTSPESLTSSKSGAGSPTSTIETSSKRAIGVVRVSRVGGRDGEQFVSPSEQAERIRTACERDGLTLVDTIEELDVSGGAPLARRAGLRRAVEMVEAGEAEVVVVAYLDRLVRSLSVQAEVVGRVEAAGGAILAVDVGALTNGSAGQWLSGTMLGAVAEYARRVTAERTQDAKRRAVERGVPPFPNIPPGYQRREDGTLEPHPGEAATVADAFRLRAGGATVMEVREHLRANGIERSFHGTTALLGSRVVLGELSFGKLLNPDSHPALIDAETWGRVQRMKSPRGRRAKSERLLARLSVLRCGTCGARLVVGTQRQHGRTYPFYRCNPTSDCPRRVTISAEIAETAVVQAVQAALAGVKGTASLSEGVADAERALAVAEQELDAAVQAFTGLEDVASTRSRLLELREARDQARDRLAELQAAVVPAGFTITADDWNLLTLDERRALIRATIESATVAPGRGSDRLTIKLRGE
jgi:site-specific DNA recombinase